MVIGSGISDLAWSRGGREGGTGNRGLAGRAALPYIRTRGSFVGTTARERRFDMWLLMKLFKPSAHPLTLIPRFERWRSLNPGQRIDP